MVRHQPRRLLLPVGLLQPIQHLEHVLTMNKAVARSVAVPFWLMKPTRPLGGAWPRMADRDQ
jgi:hypothetical protein